MLRAKIKTDTVTALKAGDKAKVATLRLMSAAVQSAEIEGGAGKVITDTDVLAVLTKMVKQRRDSIEQFTTGGRPELAAKEAEEITVIELYLPKQMGEAETNAAIGAAITEAGATSAKDMGKVMAVLKAKHAGVMDFGKASGMVKELLK
jgi:uncharacterized protein